jgi:thiol-disulfide isomerase/thioredoxin
MRLILLAFIYVFATYSSYGQEKTLTFSEAIKNNIKKYNTQSDKEFEKGDLEKGNALFDSLVQNHLVGSRFDDYSFKSVNSRKVKLSKIKKPVFIITYASWCVINKGEIPALNKLARKYSDDIQFIVVFWDVKSDAKKSARQFNKQIKVCYANESYKNDQSVIATLKHSLGFPTSYFLNADLEVVDIKRGGVPIPPRTSFKKAFDMNFTVFNDRMVSFLNKKDYEVGQLASTTE